MTTYFTVYSNKIVVTENGMTTSFNRDYYDWFRKEDAIVIVFQKNRHAVEILECDNQRIC